MIRSNEKFRRNRLLAIGWMAALLVASAVYWWVMTNYVVRDFWDPAFEQKYDRLRACVKANPRRPLWLVLGSSQVDIALRPEVLVGRFRGKNDPLIFNFGMTSASVFRQLVNLRRLLAAGIKPGRVGIEIMGPLMDRKTDIYADDLRLVIRARADEVDELCRHAADPSAVRAAWRESRLNPFYEFGIQLPGQALPERLLPLPGIGLLESHPYDQWGWLKGVPESSPDKYAQKLLSARMEFVNDFNENFVISPLVDNDLRAILDLCRKDGIEVFLVRMPEAPDFQVFYSPQANAAIASYLEKIKAEYGVRVINARSWFPDGTHFFDGHHLDATGGAMFTRRFADELMSQ